VPPPLSGEDIDNKFMWILAMVPIVGAIIDLIAETVLFFPSIVANVVFCMIDERKLKAAGHAAPEHWSVFIVPVYIWKRATLLNHKRYYFGAWVTAFFLSVLIDIGGNQVIIEETACLIVTDIVKEQLYDSAKCMGVEIDKEVSVGFYKGTAILENGSELSILIKEQGDGMVYVEIPN